MKSLYENIVKEYGSVSAYNLSIRPDWIQKNNKPWSKEEVEAFILKEVGRNIVWPTTYHVLIKTFMDYDQVDLGDGSKITRSKSHVEQEQWQERKGIVLAWGPDAFTDRNRFPSGPVCNIGDKIIYRRLENSPLKANRVPVSYILDDKIALLTDDFKGVSTQNIIGR